MQTLGDRIHETAAKLQADPAAGITEPSVTASLSNGHARLTSGPFNWESDLGPGIGGENLAPSPTAYLLGALAGCAVVFLRDTLAPLFEVTIEEIEATASCRSDVGGLLGIDGRDPALADIRLDIRIGSADPADRIEAMTAAWKKRCPIYLALIDPNAVSVNFEIGASSTN